MAIYAILFLTSCRPFWLFCFYSMFIQLWLKEKSCNMSHKIAISKVPKVFKELNTHIHFFLFYVQTILVQCARGRIFLQIHGLSGQLKCGSKSPQKSDKSQSVKGKHRLFLHYFPYLQSLVYKVRHSFYTCILCHCFLTVSDYVPN